MRFFIYICIAINIFSISLEKMVYRVIKYMSMKLFSTLVGLAAAILSFPAFGQAYHLPKLRTDVPRDSIILSDPAILADKATGTYYMTGTGGMLWKSKDLEKWDGPAKVAIPDSLSWTGGNPAIWAAELHEHDGKYYYFATFTNEKTRLPGDLPRRSSAIFSSDTPDGPYTPIASRSQTPEEKLTLDGTFWVEDGTPYMVYCHEWLQSNDGTVEMVPLSSDLTTATGEPVLLFRASDSPWSREKIDGKVGPNRVTDGPWLFRTGTGKLGMIWTSWIYDVYTQGVAYSESGTLAGPWIQEPEPITPPNFGHGMIFTDFDGRTLLSCHSHRVGEKGRYIRVPHLFEIDLSGDKLKVIRQL